jgi:hypothetical protein
VILFEKNSKITSRVNVIPLGKYEVQTLDERIESGGYGPFKYTVIIPNEQHTRDDPQLPKIALLLSCDCCVPTLKL